MQSTCCQESSIAVHDQTCPQPKLPPGNASCLASSFLFPIHISRSEQACLARQDLSHTHLAHVLECVMIVISTTTISLVLCAGCHNAGPGIANQGRGSAGECPQPPLLHPAEPLQNPWGCSALPGGSGNGHNKQLMTIH